MFVNAAPFTERSILKPPSFAELSFHDKCTAEADAAAALRFVGAAGIAVAVDVGVGVGVGVDVGVGVGVGVGVDVGVGVGVGGGVEMVLLIWTIFAIEGTPFEFRMNSM